MKARRSRHPPYYCALTVAGSDSCAGAGIQADLKTLSALGVYGTSVITAVTAQNTVGVQGIFPIEPWFVRQQLDSIFSDIPIRAVKTGMLYSTEIIQQLVTALKHYSSFEHLVVDPVLVVSCCIHLFIDIYSKLCIIIGKRWFLFVNQRCFGDA
jgi:hydroxymethylpyrimidine kinase/phosphomethylpyrimidine kinase